MPLFQIMAVQYLAAEGESGDCKISVNGHLCICICKHESPQTHITDHALDVSHALEVRMIKRFLKIFNVLVR